MASPLKTPTAKSKANLKKGGQPGRSAGEKREQEKEVRRISRTLLLSKAYQDRLKARLDSGTLQPGVEAMLWYYAFGKPPETVETKQIVPVRIQHQYSE